MKFRSAVTGLYTPATDVPAVKHDCCRGGRRHALTNGSPNPTDLAQSLGQFNVHHAQKMGG